MKTDNMKKTAEKSGRGGMREMIEALVVAVVFALFIRCWVIQAFRIPTGSMIPTFLIHDHILVTKSGFWGEAWKPGDILVFRFPKKSAKGNQDFVKRMIAGPGDVVELKNDVLYYNSRPVEMEPYRYLDPGVIRKADFGPFTIPQNHVFMMGDNRHNSYDSRSWGPLPMRYLKGRSLFLYFPPHRWRLIVNPGEFEKNT